MTEEIANVTITRRLGPMDNGVRREILYFKWEGGLDAQIVIAGELIDQIRAERGDNATNDEVVNGYLPWRMEFVRTVEPNAFAYKRHREGYTDEMMAKDIEIRRPYNEMRRAVPCVQCGAPSETECSYTGFLCCGIRLCGKCRCPMHGGM